MKRQSAKQAAAYAKNQLWRMDFIQKHGHCFVCGGTLFMRMSDGRIIMALCVDEIVPGTGYRMKSFEKIAACLVCCDYCNTHVTPGMPLARRLAYKFKHDKENFSLEVIRAIKDNGRHPVVVTMDDVKKELATI
jgi:hypothetical protein